MSRPIRTIVVAACVLALHVAALWALDNSLRAHKPEIVVPVQMLAQLLAPAQPVAQRAASPAPVAIETPPPKPLPPKPAPRKVPVPQPPVKPAPRLPEPQPAPAIPVAPAQTPAPAAAIPSPSQPVTATATSGASDTGSQSAAPAAPAAVATDRPSTAAIAAAPPAAPTPAPVELPSSDARYLQNPKPRYPPISLRLREQGTVLVNVLVSEQGQAKEAEIKTSSGFYRLDNAAVSTILTWRFVPGKRNGVAQAMWFTVPITFGIQ